MKTWKSIALWKKILVGVVLGIILGFASPAAAHAIKPLGDIFLRMLKMLIVPLVFFSITSGICKMGDIKQLRTVGFRYVLWIVISAVVAAICGIIGALIAQPGRGTTEFLAAQEASSVSYNFINNVVEWVPTNIVESMTNANLLQIIVFCLFLGVALLALGPKVAGLVKIINEGNETVLKITEYVMEFSPFGIFSLMATMVSTVSNALMLEVVKFIVLDNIVALIVLVVFIPLAVKLTTGLSPIKFFKNIAPAMIVALSTTSSAATLPVSLKLADEELGIPENVYGFTLPLGNTCGMIGFAIFLGMCCVFASNLYGFAISAASIAQFIFLGLILSIGAAGVKGAGVVMSTVLLETLGMPLTLIPILAAIWPCIDPAHTLMNNVGDLAGTTIVAKSLNMMDVDKFNK